LKQAGKSPLQKNGSENRLRIIGGQWRGRKLAFPDVNGLRPTGDRIRETLFNWLAPEIAGARCLDIFAGSGALGIEALSRGAAVSVMIERDRQAANAIRSNLRILNAPAASLIEGDSLQILAAGNREQPYDVVFIDPPFSLDIWQAVIDALIAGNWLAETATIYIETPADKLLSVPSDWTLHRDKRSGSVSYRLYWSGQQ